MDSSPHAKLIEELELAAQRQRKWHRENYTPAHSPLAGDITGTSYDHVRYLPSLQYRSSWNSDTLQIPSHSLSNLNFNPRYLNSKRFQGLLILENLPIEHRRLIYDQLIHSYSTFTPYPETYTRPWGSKLAMARRNRTPTFGPLNDIPNSGPCSNKCLNDTTFDQRFGMLDFFKECEWASIKAAVGVMEKFQVFRESVSGRAVWGRRREGAVEDVLEDFMGYFWEEVVVDVRFNEGDLRYAGPFILPRSAKLYKFPSEERILHSRILHITLQCSSGDSASNWLFRKTNTERTLTNQPTFPVPRGPSPFIQRCKFISAHLPNLLTTSIFLKMRPEAMGQVKAYFEAHPKDPRAGLKAFKSMVPWARTVMNIPVKETLQLALFVTLGQGEYDTACAVGSCWRMAELNALMQRCANAYLSPMYLNRWDGEQYFGLGELFREV